MIKFETTEPGKCTLEVKGSIHEIGCDAGYMISLIYRDIFKSSPLEAVKFRYCTMHAINGAMDAIERGEFENDSDN